jgi:hypothetical protein
MTSHLRRLVRSGNSQIGSGFGGGILAICAACAMLAGCGATASGSPVGGNGIQVPTVTGGSAASACCSPAATAQHASSPAGEGRAAPGRGHPTVPASRTTRPSGSASSPAPTGSAPPPTATGNGAACSGARNTPGGPDPWGGCWPGAGNTGVPAGTTLRHYTGPCTIRHSHVVISAKSVSCPLVILEPDVTIKDSSIAGTVHTDGPGSVLIEHTTINGGSDHSESVGGANLTVLSDNIYGDQHEVHCYSNCTVENSWLHNNYNGAALGWHENGFFNDGGSGFTIVHNSVYCVGGCTGDITLIPDGNVSNATISQNLLVATPYASYCLYPASDPPAKPGIMSHIVVTYNVFQRGANGKCATYGPVYGWDRPNNTPGTDGYRNVWLGNIWNNGKPLQP